MALLWISLTLLFYLILHPTAVCCSPEIGDKPHIVFLMVDDWGWANVGYHRDKPTKDISTPNLDLLVKEGLQLDQHYAYRWCSPSRSAFLSGRVPIHVNDAEGCGLCYNPNDTVSGYQGIPLNMTLLSTKLKSVGYATHLVGKWHVGVATKHHIPKGRDFDSSFGYLFAANDYYNETMGLCEGIEMVDLWDTDIPAKDKNGTDYEEQMFRERVLEIVKGHDSSTPLFLYFAPHIVHRPYQVPKRYLDMFSFIDNDLRQIYHAMVKYLDDVLGDVVQALKNRGFWDKLLFVTSSDNGGPISSAAAANNYPLKGGKHSDWQGGVRVNAFVSGGYLPKKMRGGKTEGYMHIADWYSTFCSLAGVDPTDEMAAKAKLPPIDSLNMWPLISGQNSTSPRTDIPISNATLISGDYKILTGDIGQAGWTGPTFPNNTVPNTGYTRFIEHCGEKGCLYNIKDDPNEHVNLADSMPDVLLMMQKKLKSYQATRFEPDRGKQPTKVCDVALNKYGGFWGPFILD